MVNDINLELGLGAFIDACPPGYHFAAGNPVPLPAAHERAFLHVVAAIPRMSPDELQAVRDALAYKDFYVLTTFAVRIAILAVRTHDRALLKKAIAAFFIDGQVVDYRDVLARVAILNDCALRLQEDLQSLVRPYAHLAADCRWRLMQRFFRRMEEHKEVCVFGLSAWEGPDGVEYA